MLNIKEIGKRIQTERKAQKKSKDVLADEIGTTRQTLSKWENGTSSPGLWDLVRLCEIFSCDFGYIVGEYDCKTRVATDIKKETGLSEGAISCLQDFKEMSDRQEPPPSGISLELLNQLGKQYCDFYSQFITDLTMRGILGYYLGKVINIKCYGLSEQDEKIFDDDKEALRYYLFQIEQGLMEFLNKFIDNEVKGD